MEDWQIYFWLTEHMGLLHAGLIVCWAIMAGLVAALLFCLREERKMKKGFLLMLLLPAVLLLAGCGITGVNKITTYDQQGNITGIQEMSDDAVYYDRIAAGKTQVNCAGMTFEQCGLLIAIGGLVDVAKGYPARGMNGFELAAKISGDVVSAVPYGAIGFVAYEALKRPASVNMNGDNGVYSTNETHLTGNDLGDGNAVNIPNDSPPTTTTTTGVVE